MLLIESDPSVKSCLLVEERCILIPKPRGPQNIRKQPDSCKKHLWLFGEWHDSRFFSTKTTLLNKKRCGTLMPFKKIWRKHIWWCLGIYFQSSTVAISLFSLAVQPFSRDERRWPMRDRTQAAGTSSFFFGGNGNFETFFWNLIPKKLSRTFRMVDILYHPRR